VSHTCQRCGETKGADDMVIRGGKPSKTCKACFSASFKKKSGGVRP
jgi:formylmethanofuran dehydrogenase subunit E